MATAPLAPPLHSPSSTHAPPGSPAPPAEPSHSSRDWGWIAFVVAGALPWLIFRFTTDVHHAPAALVAALSGLAILAAAFLLSWAAEVLQLDFSQAFALALLSLIAVLPEYAVDIVFAWRAAADPTQAPYAVANMTGANRLLIGLGWSAVVLVAWWRARMRRQSLPPAETFREGHPSAPDPDVVHTPSHAAGTRSAPGDAVALEPGQAIELAALGLATLYSFIIPLKGGIGLLDTAVLVSLFAVYAWATARAPSEEPHLVGPAALVGSLSKGSRRLATALLFLYSAGVIFVAAEPFAEGLVRSGAALGIDEFLLVQWLAPLASESPEFVVALLFAWRGLAGAGLRTLVASKVNQWTLLIGTLGLAYSIALGQPADLPLDVRQSEELFLTSAQSLFALALIANFDLSVRESLVLLGTFLLQLFFPGTEVRIAFGVLYFVVGIGLVAFTPSRRRSVRAMPRLLREALRLGS